MDEIDYEPTTRERLLADLTEWASENRATDDVYLNIVAGVLVGEESAAQLVGLNPDVWFPPAQTRLSTRVAWIIRVISMVRNVLIFAPVAITWLAISQATSAFNFYVQESQGVPVNFLQFWQDGYGYLTTEWTISNVALMDFAIIVIIALLSTAIGGGQTFGNRTVARSLAEHAQLRKVLILKLRAEIPEMGGVMTGKSSATPREVEAAIRRIDKAVAKLEPSIQSLATSLSRARDGLDNLSGQAATSMSSVKVDTKKLETSLRRFADAADKLSEAAAVNRATASANHKATADATTKAAANAREIGVIARETRESLNRLKQALARITDSRE